MENGGWNGREERGAEIKRWEGKERQGREGKGGAGGRKMGVGLCRLPPAEIYAGAYGQRRSYMQPHQITLAFCLLGFRPRLNI